MTIGSEARAHELMDDVPKTVAKVYPTMVVKKNNGI
jgi:hypothetical protein